MGLARYELPEDDELDSTDAFAPTAPEWMDDEPAGGDGGQLANAATERRGTTIDEVLTGWRSDGPLVHEPTGILRLDELTGGGPVYGTRWYFSGPPDVAKTLLVLHLGHTFALRGIAVGLLAVDEEAGDLVTRLIQRIGYQRVDCEVRDAETLTRIREELGDLPIRFYDDSWTIESAAEDLATFARGRGDARAMLGVDSIQTVKCDAESTAALAGRELSEVGAVTARVRAVRAVATKYRLIALATSEMGRGAYRSSDPSQQTATMASAKWSGAVEYSARVLLGLRSVSGESDLVDVELAKNKHGPRDEHVFLRLDRRSQTLAPANYEPAPEATEADRDARAVTRVTQDAIVVARALEESPGTTARALRSRVRAAAGIGHERTDAAVSALASAVVKGEVGPRGAIPLTLNRSLLPEGIRRAMEGS